MADDEQNAEPTSHETVHPVAPPPPRRHWGMRLAGIFILLPVLILVGWTLVALNWSYSTGYRDGIVQKFSRKGWLCKTWEGQLAIGNFPGSVQEQFEFTVHNDSVAQEITRHMGKRVALTYEEHKGAPTSCFGDTRYYVIGVTATP